MANTGCNQICNVMLNIRTVASSYCYYACKTVKMDCDRDWSQIFTIVTACIPGLSSALILTWPSAFIPIITQNDTNYKLSEDQANLLPVISAVGFLPALIFYKIPDIIGRKRTLLLLTIPQALYWLITIFANDFIWLCVARLIGGLSDAVMYSALPIYLGEVTTPRIRGTWGNGQTFSFNAGFFLISAFGSYLSVQATAYIFVSLPILFMVLFFWLPESPYYSVIKNRPEEARQALKWLLRKPEVESDFQQLKKDVERQISENGSWSDLFRIQSNRKALVACVFVRYGQQLAGIGAFEGYLQFIFLKVGAISLSPQISAMLFSGTLWIFMTTFSIYLDRFGRRKPFIVSTLGCAVCLAVESCYFYFDEFLDLTSINWVPIVSLLVYIWFYCMGVGILPSLMAGELFSASVKTKALALANFMLGLVSLLVMYIFKMLSSIIGLYAPFAFYSVMSLVCFSLSFSIVPETRGKTLEEIQQDIKRSKKVQISVLPSAP